MKNGILMSVLVSADIGCTYSDVIRHEIVTSSSTKRLNDYLL